MPLRLYPPLLAALMIALAAAIPGAFWWHARSARLRHPSYRMSATAAGRSTPGTTGPAVPASEAPGARTDAARPFRAARIDSRTTRAPDADDSPALTPAAVSAPGPAPTPRRGHRHRRR